MVESRTVQPRFAYKELEDLWSVQKSTTFLSLTRPSKTMPVDILPASGIYLLEFHEEFLKLPDPGPWYLTSNGEGQQLFIDHRSNLHNQEVN